MFNPGDHMMDFRIQGLSPEPFLPLYGLSDEELANRTPYRASHAVFVLEGAEKRYDAVNEVPEVLLRRLISIRAFDLNHWMVEGDATRIERA
jgi:hypothetical protein